MGKFVSVRTLVLSSEGFQPIIVESLLAYIALSRVGGMNSSAGGVPPHVLRTYKPVNVAFVSEGHSAAGP